MSRETPTSESEKKGYEKAHAHETGDKKEDQQRQYPRTNRPGQNTTEQKHLRPDSQQRRLGESGSRKHAPERKNIYNLK